MTARIFVDTNVLVYAADVSEPAKQAGSADWVAAIWRARNGRISLQVLHEYYVTATRKLSAPLTIREARQQVTDLLAWRPIANDESVMQEAWRLQDRYQFAWWDALILAAALQQDCRYLLTENLQAGQAIEGLTAISPFTTAPGEIL